MTTINDLKVGVKLKLGAWPEEGIPEEFGELEWIADEERPGNPGEGLEATVRVPPHLRDSDDRDGIREVFFDEETLKRTEVIAEWPSATRVGDVVELVSCSDPHTRLERGERGTVRLIDALGTVHVDWESGSNLGLVPGEDAWKVVQEETS